MCEFLFSLISQLFGGRIEWRMGTKKGRYLQKNMDVQPVHNSFIENSTTAMKIYVVAFWVMIPWSLVSDNQHFGETFVPPSFTAFICRPEDKVSMKSLVF
jgi:hypothetical protein